MFPMYYPYTNTTIDYCMVRQLEYLDKGDER
jgi:hypothetical protein